MLYKELSKKWINQGFEISCYFTRRAGARVTGSFANIVTCSCTEYHWFWVAWTSTGAVSGGVGTVIGENITTFFQDTRSPTVVINRISIATMGPVSYWLIPGCYYPRKDFYNVDVLRSTNTRLCGVSYFTSVRLIASNFLSRVKQII